MEGLAVTSPREIRQSNEHEHLLSLLPDNLRVGVLDGTYEVLPGKSAKKPVVRRSDTKALVKGSGQYPKAPDGAEVGRATAHKQRVEYREAMQAFIPVLANVPAGERQEATRSFEALLDAAYLAAQGVPTRVECEHLDEFGDPCRTKHIVAFKPDGNLLWRMIENLVGKATETKEIDVRAQVLQQIAERRVVDVRILDGVSEDEQRRRIDILTESGLTDIEAGSVRDADD